MITRPLDLSTRLRPAPRSFDYLFWINGILIALMFLFFGSRFVLSPGVGVGRVDEILPYHPRSVEGAVATHLTLNVTQGGQLYVDSGFVTLDQFRAWIREEAEKNPGAGLLIHCNVQNSTELLLEVTAAAHAVGLKVQLATIDSRAGSPNP